MALCGLSPQPCLQRLLMAERLGERTQLEKAGFAAAGKRLMGKASEAMFSNQRGLERGNG
jgi:hypothetical protein